MADHASLRRLLETLRTSQAGDRARVRQQLTMARLEASEWQQVLAVLLERWSDSSRLGGEGDGKWVEKSDGWLGELVLSELPRTVAVDDGWDLVVERAAALYGRLPECGAGRFLVLEWLAGLGTRRALSKFVELYRSDPPPDPVAAARACVPLFQRPPRAAEAVFPALLDALAVPAAAPVVLDLANYWTAQGVLTGHPARQRPGLVLEKLRATLQRLAEWDESRPEDAVSRAQLRADLQSAEALWGPLCHAAACCGAPEAAEVLHAALGVNHRRLRVEAAAALAEMGEPAGAEALASLAAEPVVRRRALKALAEVEQLGRVAAALLTPSAMAEGELAEWLAAPAQFGLAPQVIEHLDSRRQYWPGYEQPVECHLLRYEYRLPAGKLSGVGIVGPLCFSLSVDLQRLSLEDVYALYAGWHAEHPEMVEIDPDELSSEQRAAWEAVLARLFSLGYHDVELAKLGLFFETPAFVAEANRAGRRGVVVVDPRGIEWRGADQSTAGLSPQEAYCLYKGRELLRSFNP